MINQTKQSLLIVITFINLGTLGYLIYQHDIKSASFFFAGLVIPAVIKTIKEA